MKRLSWKYLAGLIDGEGCLDVQITGHKWVRPRIRIVLREDCKFLLEMIQNSNGGYLLYRKFDNPTWGNAYSWELAGYKSSCKFLRNIIKWLVLKKEQARFLVWMETNLKGKWVSDEVRKTLRQELKLMKRDPQRLSERAQEEVLAKL